MALYYLDTPEQDAALLDGYKSVRPLPVYSENAMKALLLQRRLLLLNYLFETKNAEHKEMLPAYLEKSMERVSAFSEYTGSGRTLLYPSSNAASCSGVSR